MDKSLYEALGVEPDATTQEIRQAYRKLAKKHHPDKGGDEAIFTRLKLAHDVLTNPQRRAHYDQNGLYDEGRDPADSVRIKALAFIVEAFREALLNPNWDPAALDILDHIRGEADQELRRYKTVLKDAKALKRRLEKTMERLTRKSAEGENLFASVTRKALDDLESDSVKIQLKLDVANTVKDIMTEYEYRVDERAPRSAFDLLSPSEEDLYAEVISHLKGLR